MNNIPDNGPAIIVFYHSTIPNDYHYLLCRIFLDKKRKIFTITDRLLFYIPGWSLLLNALQSIPGTRKDCVQLLKQNRLIALSPGGLREGLLKFMKKKFQKSKKSIFFKKKCSNVW